MKPWWIILAVYVIGYVLMWRTVSWAILSDVSPDNPDGVDICMTVLLGSLGTLLWPIILTGLAVRTVYRRKDGEAVYALMPRRVRRERELRDREKRIAAMERELGIGQRG